MNIAALAWLSAVNCGLYLWLFIRLMRSGYWITCPAFSFNLLYSAVYLAIWNPYNPARYVPWETFALVLKALIVIEAIALETEYWVSWREKKWLAVSVIGLATVAMAILSMGNTLTFLWSSKLYAHGALAVICVGVRGYLWANPIKNGYKLARQHATLLCFFLCFRFAISLAGLTIKCDAVECDPVRWMEVSTAALIGTNLFLLRWFQLIEPLPPPRLVYSLKGS